MQPKIEKLYTVNKKRPGADCGSDHELLITKFRFKLKKVGKRVPDELWNEVHNIVQETGIRPFPWKRNAKKQNGYLGRPYK